MAKSGAPGSFGGKLRDARERRGISLREIANTTKISMSALEALERNDLARLPGGIFSRAFVRSYALEVGLDPEETIREFLAQCPSDSVTAGHPASEHLDDGDTIESDRRMASTFLRLVLISVPIAAVVLYFGTVGRHSPPISLATPVTGVAAAPTDALPAAAPADAPATPGATQVVDLAATGRLTVGLSVTKPGRVSATVDGQKAIDRLMQPGELLTMEVRRELTLTVDDASVLTMTINGAAARPLGPPGKGVTARLDLMNFKEYLPAR
jgi:cytoskeletal protein RodZ